MNASTNLRDEKEQTITKVNVTWQDVEDFIEYIADKTNNFENYNGVYGPARGGLIFAVIISNRYGLPFLGAPQKECIIVDDIVDSGKTAMCWLEKGYDIITMYYKENELNIKPNYWYRQKFDEWILFPWE